MIRTNTPPHVRNLQYNIHKPTHREGESGKLADEALVYIQQLNANNRIFRALGVDTSDIHMGTLELWGVNDTIRATLFGDPNGIEVDLSFETTTKAGDRQTNYLSRVLLDNPVPVSTAEAHGREGVVRVGYRF